MKHGISSKKGYEINYKRYFLASKIGSKSMLNKIINRLKWYVAKLLNKIDKIMEKLGYYFVGYKVDINENYKDIKALKKEINTLNDKLNKHINLSN